MGTTPKVLKHVTPSAQKMITARELAPLLDRVFQEVQALQLTRFQVQKVDVEWEVDPEVKGWEMLSVTLLCRGSVEDAWSCWQELDRAMKHLRERLSEVDLDKLDKYLSVGVDIE